MPEDFGGIKVEGGRELRKALKTVDDKLDNLKDLNNKVGRFVAEAIRADAPRRSGNLAATIRANRASAKAVVAMGKKKVPYAGPIIWGWGRRNIKANPFPQRAARATESVWTEMYATGIQEILDRAEKSAQ